MNAEQIKKLNAVLGNQTRRQAAIEQAVQAVVSEFQVFKQYMENFRPPRSVTEEIDAINGRRIYYNLCGRIDFTAAMQGTRGTPITMQVSQDGPFVQTHYPFVIWKANLPTNADNFGFWSPVVSSPLPTQQVGANQDRIDLSYEVVDGGAQRNFQNEAAPPIFSRPDALMPLPVPTLFTPNATVQFFPTYERVLFATGATVDTTQGQLVVALPGYRIVNL